MADSGVPLPASKPPTKEWLKERRAEAAAGGGRQASPPTQPVRAAAPSSMDPESEEMMLSPEMMFTSSGNIAPWLVAWTRTTNGLLTPANYHFEPTFWTNQYDGPPGCPCPTVCPSLCGFACAQCQPPYGGLGTLCCPLGLLQCSPLCPVLGNVAFPCRTPFPDRGPRTPVCSSCASAGCHPWQDLTGAAVAFDAFGKLLRYTFTCGFVSKKAPDSSYCYCCKPICCTNEQYNNALYTSINFNLGRGLTSAMSGGGFNTRFVQALFDASQPYWILGFPYYLNFPRWPLPSLPCYPCWSTTTVPSSNDGVSYCYASRFVLPPAAWNSYDQPIMSSGIWAWPKGTGRRDPNTGQPDRLPPLPDDDQKEWDKTSLPVEYQGVMPRNKKLILNYHGGGYLFLGAVNQSLITTKLVQSTGATVLAVDYPRPPQTMFGGRGANMTPTYDPSVDDSPLACGRFAFQMASNIWGMENICLTGDSAGGNLTLAVALSVQGRGGYMDSESPIYPALRDKDGRILRPAGIALNSPWVDLRRMAYQANAPESPWPAGMWPAGPPGDWTVTPGTEPTPVVPPRAPPVPESFTCCGLPLGLCSAPGCKPMPAPMPAPTPIPAPKPMPPPMETMELNDGLGYWNESVGRNNQLHFAWARYGQAGGGDYLPPSGVAVAAELYRTGFPGLTSNNAGPAPPWPGATVTFLTQAEWEGTSPIISPVMMSAEDAEALPQSVWLSTGRSEIFYSQIMRLRQILVASGRLKEPDSETPFMGTSFVPVEAAHDWIAIGLPSTDFEPLNQLWWSFSMFFNEVFDGKRPVQYPEML